MGTHDSTPRRGFLTRLAGAAAALGAGGAAGGGRLAAQQVSPHDRWLTALNARHRCLFDFPAHQGGVPLIHMYNFIDTYRRAYDEPASTCNVIGTCYGAPGATASMPLAWNDGVWDKYRIGEILELTDPVTRAPARRNMFFRPRSGDPVLRNATVPGASMEALTRSGAVFLMCNNAFLAWMGFLSGAGTKGNPADIERDIRSNLLPGVVTVPGIVIAIEKAQAAGIAYNRQ
jgi:hypothetical protein